MSISSGTPSSSLSPTKTVVVVVGTVVVVVETDVVVVVGTVVVVVITVVVVVVRTEVVVVLGSDVVVLVILQSAWAWHPRQVVPATLYACKTVKGHSPGSVRGWQTIQFAGSTLPIAGRPL